MQNSCSLFIAFILHWCHSCWATVKEMHVNPNWQCNMWHIPGDIFKSWSGTNSKINLKHYNVVFSLSVQLWANVLFSTGQQTPDYEERRHPDTQPQDVQQVQEEQTSRGRLRRAIQVHAGQGLSVWRCTRPHKPHDPHGSPAPLQPLGTHAAYSHAHSPFIRSPPPLQSLASLGWASLRPLKTQNPSSACRSHHIASKMASTSRRKLSRLCVMYSGWRGGTFSWT